YGGVNADEVVVRLLDEHWKAKCIAAMEHYRQADPQGWKEYLHEADEWDDISAPPVDPWNEAIA
ncbi:MAG: hypothetical protein ACREP9_12605, partial [Candidatus Dormibacteraceae bacterium]